VLKPTAVSTVLTVGLLLLPEAALAADTGCVSDAGIPHGVIAPIDVGHMRKSLADAGFAVGGVYLGETFANTGGIHQGATYDGVLWTYLIGDLHKAGLWKGLCFYTDAYQIHGRTITGDDIGSLVTVSNYEALPSTRLSELWLEQHMLNDHLTVRVGQLTADTEFLLSSGGSNFLDSTWAWATLPSADLPGGALLILSQRPACASHLSPMTTGASCSACTMAIPPAPTAQAILNSATITDSTSDSIRRPC
jgi:carbohydrate-selective porin OprB